MQRHLNRPRLMALSWQGVWTATPTIGEEVEWRPPLLCDLWVSLHNGRACVGNQQCWGGGAGKQTRTLPHSAQPQHTHHWAPRTRKRHQQEHRPQRPTERSDPTQHAKGLSRALKGTTTRRTVTQGAGKQGRMEAGRKAKEGCRERAGGGGGGEINDSAQVMSLRRCLLSDTCCTWLSHGWALFAESAV